MVDFSTARQVMVDNQLRTSAVSDRRLLAAMGSVPRERFVPEARRMIAYADVAHTLSTRRSMASPAQFARLVQLAEIEHDETILDVGTGTGYSAAVLAHIGADVTALESDETLAAAARETLDELGVSNVEVLPKAQDGAKYDVIVFEGAVATAPDDFFDLLKDGGRLVVVVAAGGAPSAHLFVRSGDDIAERVAFNASMPALESAKAPDAFVF
ncbi:protein-L-isoaspartate O-methyltransferase family protein [Devosia sp.]|uniref:protein-L-isoaspartate O-methyltransferase family protein n=1 Tax=Devosia sp. TaxID=1871048 RepID=UPI003A948D76